MLNLLSFSVVDNNNSFLKQLKQNDKIAFHVLNLSERMYMYMKGMKHKKTDSLEFICRLCTLGVDLSL